MELGETVRQDKPVLPLCNPRNSVSTHNLQVVIEITKQITDRESRYGTCFANVRAAELVYKTAICRRVGGGGGRNI